MAQSGKKGNYMRNTVLATFVLAAGMALAQTSATPSTVQGCLSGASGNFTFTDQSGTSWTLTGNTDNLKEHIGNTVEITGNEDTTNHTISVNDIKDVSKGCNQTSSSNMSNGQATATATGPGGTNQQPTTAQPTNSEWSQQTANPTTTPDTNPVAQNNAASVPDTSANAQQPDYAPQGTQSTPNAQTAAQDQSTANPQESNPNQNETSTSASTGTAGSVQGCLSGSMGSFSITDQSGKTWTLSGDTNELQKHVGNTVQISGSQDTTNNSIAVSNVTDVSQGCQQGAGSNQPATATGTNETSTAGMTTSQSAAPSTATETTSQNAAGANPEEAPGTNSQDIRKNPAQSDIPSGQPQIDATNNPPTFGGQQNPSQTSSSTATGAATTSSTAQTGSAGMNQTQPATTTAPAASATNEQPTTEQQPSPMEQNPSTSAQTTTTEQPSTEASTAATTTEQSQTAAQNEYGANQNPNQNATAEQATQNQNAAANRGQLPQTASPLPLLLLLGLGSIAGGVLAFRRVKA